MLSINFPTILLFVSIIICLILLFIDPVKYQEKRPKFLCYFSKIIIAIQMLLVAYNIPTFIFAIIKKIYEVKKIPGNIIYIILSFIICGCIYYTTFWGNNGRRQFKCRILTFYLCMTINIIWFFLIYKKFTNLNNALLYTAITFFILFACNYIECGQYCKKFSNLESKIRIKKENYIYKRNRRLGTREHRRKQIRKFFNLFKKKSNTKSTESSNPNITWMDK